jgi:hypothetical protein
MLRGVAFTAKEREPERLKRPIEATLVVVQDVVIACGTILGDQLTEPAKDFVAEVRGAMKIVHPSKLNPHRLLAAARVLAYIVWRGGKIFLTPHDYTQIRRATRLTRGEVNQATNDLFDRNEIDIRMAGETQVLEQRHEY